MQPLVALRLRERLPVSRGLVSPGRPSARGLRWGAPPAHRGHVLAACGLRRRRGCPRALHA
eukprot:292810-Pyramimonas_sp.AAC.1